MELQKYEKEHLELVLKSAAECCVLLKSDGSFPIMEPGKIAAYGNGVRHTVKGGTGSGEVNSRFSVNVEQGLEDNGFEITTKDWLDAYDSVRIAAKKQFVKDLKAEAKSLGENPMFYCMGKYMSEPDHNLEVKKLCDTAIYVLTRDSGEGTDRSVKAGDVKLAKSEIRDILKLNELYENFMLVLNVGGVVDLSEVLEVKNILLLSQLGVVTGDILAYILLGEQNPSGKLATTWSRWEDYSSLGSFGQKDDTDYKEGIYVGYRYFDSMGLEPLFPFGFGKSYTSFDFSDSDLTVKDGMITVKTAVKNTGKIPGKEVVQVYLSSPSGKLDKPYQDLVAFAKSPELAPDEKYTVSAQFSLLDAASYDEETASYILEKGDYLVRVGNSSRNTRIVGVLNLDETVTTLKAKNVVGTPGFKDFVPNVNYPQPNLEGAKLIKLEASAFATEAVKYDIAYPVDDIVKNLSDEDIAMMGIGSHDPNKKGFAAVIGNAAPHIAGGAGETCSLFTDKGINYLTMSDGPAGLRLARDFYEDEKGAHGIGTSMIPESMVEYLSKPMKFLINILGLGGAKAPKNATIKHQFATAIPIGTAIAQTWNQDLAISYGDMVGTEMEMFGVNLWLAPALNIHRSILCGRNFEYYSEDPLISGMFAAGITLGVQKHPGCGTTIKHYAANNQEINRYACSSNVSERAMREIYLKGFGICVNQSQPHAVMTSYNLLNGIHTSEHRGLIEDILRDEYGFEGIVMTDWVIAGMVSDKCKYRGALAGEVANAGGDVFMPGSQGDYTHLLGCMKDGSLSREQMNINITRIYRMVKKLKG